jgi:hypothetical protein
VKAGVKAGVAGAKALLCGLKKRLNRSRLGKALTKALGKDGKGQEEKNQAKEIDNDWSRWARSDPSKIAWD